MQPFEAPVAAARAALLPPAFSLAAAGKPDEEKVVPGEDLMREHGVLNRALLVYEAWLETPVPPAHVLDGTANLIHRFMYRPHEAREDTDLFPPSTGWW